MWTKRILILLPVLIIVVLLQSFFWVPTYDNQGKGNPGRLIKFIESSGGDAQILNPILAADTSSSTINNLVFEGLLDYDDQLALRGRLARKWKIYEEAYLTLLPNYSINGRVLNSPKDWVDFFNENLSHEKEWIENIQSAKVISAKNVQSSINSAKLDEERNPVKQNGRVVMEEIKYQLTSPIRLKFKLKKVDPNFFLPIQKLLGKKYFESFPYANFIKAENPGKINSLVNHYSNILPVIEHNPIIVFYLRKGIKFHDGHEFDSGDVLFTYEAIMNPKNASPRTSDFEPIKYVKIIGLHKLKIVYKRLFSPAINVWTMGILPEHLLNEKQLLKEASLNNLSSEKIENLSIRDSNFNRNPIGTGPFIFQEWVGDVSINLKRNEDYWESPPEYSEYVMRIIPDALTREMEFYSGGSDDYDVQPHQVARLRKEPKYQSFSTVGFSYSYIGYNLRNPLFKSREVRKALGMAVNVNQIIQHVLYNEGERVTGPFAKVLDWYDHEVKPLPYNPEAALKLLNKEGWKKNKKGWLEKDGKIFEFNLITNSGNSIRKDIMTIVQNNWRGIGIKCNTQLFEWAVFLKDFVNALKFDALILGWATGPDPDMYQLWHSSQTNPNQLNFVGYENPEADKLIISIRQEYDRLKQIEMTRELHRLIAKDQPYTFLYVGKATKLLDKKIVIVERDEEGNEKYFKIYPTKGGEINYYFNKWKKLSFVPEFSPN